MNDDTNQRAREEALRETIDLESELACACASNERVVSVADVFRIATSAREEALREAEEKLRRYYEALVQADLKIRSYPGADQSDVEFIRVAIGEMPSLITGGGERG